MAFKYGPNNSGSIDKLIPVDPTKLFKEQTPAQSRDQLDEELEKHMNNAEKRYNNLLISPQRKIIEDVLLETPEGESADAGTIMRKIDERFSKVTDYYLQTAKSFEPLNAAGELYRTLRDPESKFGRDLTGRIVVDDYDEINGGVNPNNPESVYYHNLINGIDENNDDDKTDTIIIGEDLNEGPVDASLFNF